MTDSRKGLNCTLSYKKVDGVTRTYRVRTDSITFALAQVVDQSAGRTHRTLYPRRLTQTKFSLRVQLKGLAEYRSFENWMGTYAKYLLDTQYNSQSVLGISMKVQVPDRNFYRYGIPEGPIEWGSEVGAMLWSPIISFETTSGTKPKTSAVNYMPSGTPKYFYPTGTQLSGQSAPPTGTYYTVLTTSTAKVAPPIAITPDPPPKYILPPAGDTLTYVCMAPNHQWYFCDTQGYPLIDPNNKTQWSTVETLDPVSGGPIDQRSGNSIFPQWQTGDNTGSINPNYKEVTWQAPPGTESYGIWTDVIFASEK